jgi:SpoVK/Ycf46/Vps4 family AAA+-type ATPase
MPRTFVDIITAKANGSKIRADEALVAVLLDEIGIDPASFDKGVHAIAYPSGTVKWAIEECIAFAVEPRTVKGPDDGMHGGYVPTDVVVLDESDKKEFSSAIVAGATVVVIGEGDFIDSVDVFAQLVDRKITLPNLPSSAAVCRTIEVITGQVGVVATFHGQLLVSDVVLGTRADSTVAENVARMQSICARRVTWAREAQAQKDAEAAAKVAKEGSAIPLATAANAVVTRLRDLSGYGEAKTWGLRLAEDLHAYRVGEIEWQDVDCGVLLSGPPGSGKTFFANALAAECGVPLVITTYADWQDGANGDVMARGLKKLFAAWREQAKADPIIVFVDEIDSIGARTENGHNETWFKTIINHWLAFLDGAEPRKGVVVIAATNFPDKVDEALCRPGRLDRHIKLPTPTLSDLADVIKFHLGAGAQADDLPGAAVACRGSTPAQIAQAARDARRVARRAKRKVRASDVKTLVRSQRRKFPAHQDYSTALHEAAHALICCVLSIGWIYVDLDESRTATSALGVTATLDTVRDFATMLLAARAAEDRILGAPTAGTAKDIEMATQLTLHAIAQCALDGHLVCLPDDKALDDPFVRRRVADLLIECDLRARSLLAEHDAALHAIAKALVERRYLEADEVKAIVSSNPTISSGIDDPLAEVAAAERSATDRAKDTEIEAIIEADLAADCE